MGKLLVSPFIIQKTNNLIRRDVARVSVPLFDRSSSPIQFIEDSKTLTKDIVAWSKNQSKRSYEIIVEPIVENVVNIQYYSYLANKTRLSSEENYDKRTKYFDLALENVKDFHRRLTVNYQSSINKISDNQYQKWIGLSVNIGKQIKNIKKSDKKRMKDQDIL